jgi:hypothetical protein
MMEDGKDNQESTARQERDEIFSKAVRAGKRTYFFDVKSTRRDDYYLTITESKKRFNRDGRFFFEKHKIFLYKEDFDKFAEGLSEVVDFIKRERPVTEYQPASNENQQENTPVNQEHEQEEVVAENYTDVEFEDLGSKE